MGSQLGSDTRLKEDGADAQKSITSTSFDRIRRLLRRAKNPLGRAIQLLRQLKDMPYWTLPEGYDERLGPDMVAEVFNNGTAWQRSLIWRRDHGMEKSKVADIHLGLSDLLDAAALDDDIPGLINCAFCERLLRDAHRNQLPPHQRVCGTP